MPFIVGKYDATYDIRSGGGPRSVGQIAAGFTLEHSVSKQLITGDNEGDTVQDAVYRGHNPFVEFTLMEYISEDAVDGDGGSFDVFAPYSSDISAGGPQLDQGIIGRLDNKLVAGVPSGSAGALILTALTGTEAASQATSNRGPAVLTALSSILAEDFPVRFLMGVGLREIPVRLRIYPHRPSGSTLFYTVA